ncbi:type IV secretion system protein [Sphingomonas sp. LB-2]|uniref:type IV secretion system protein n=1 Tax=Sphingomonas caeni TaxID=2984949 RepID=UPI002231E1EF|nr:type IV secretion system protein [Sphingomonas caeni]MCW3848251.1 type IV secretion system protein [Sphingomonas caeni]
MPACQPLTYESGFVTGMLNFVDCQAQNIGSQGYQALAAPGSTLSLLLTGFLTLFVAFYGYRMLFGQTPGIRDGVMAMAKIGIVLALATSWPAYRALFYDVALHGPAEIASGVGAPAGLPGANGGIVARLQGVDAALIALNKAGVGTLAQRDKETVTRVVNGQQQTVVQPTRESDNFEPTALGWARVLYLTTAIAGFASVRLVAGLLLALGPFFIAFLLFDTTRGLFEGWLRALAAAALGAVGVTVLLGVELSLLEPWLTNLLARRAVQLSVVGAPTEMLVVTLAFAITLAAMLAAVTRLAMGFHLPASIRAVSSQLVSNLRGGEGFQRPAIAGPQVPAEQRSRAASVAEAVAATQRREAAQITVNAAQRQASATGLARDLPPPAPVPLGQSYSRRTRNRASGSAGRRDSTS